MAASVVVWLFALTLAIVHFLGEELDAATLVHQERITAFATGITVTYLFLELLPEHYKGVTVLSEFTFLFGLAGFSLIHVAERHIQTHHTSPETARKEYKELHTAFLFFYHVALGALLHILTTASLLTGTLFFLPVLLHTMVSSLSLTELHEAILDRATVKAGVAASPLLGVAIAATGLITMPVFHAVLGTVTGMFLYTVIHDALPRQGGGHVAYYLLGTAVYGGIIVTTWLAV